MTKIYFEKEDDQETVCDEEGNEYWLRKKKRML